MGVGGKCHTLAALFREKRPSNYSTGGWMGFRVQSVQVQVQKTSPPTGFQPQTFQNEVSRYANYTLLAALD